MVIRRCDWGVRSGWLGVVIAAMSLPSSAWAKREFPAELAKAADMSCVPQCTVCHTSNPGTAETVGQPFVAQMIEHNLLESGVAGAFKNMRSDPAPEVQAMVQALENDRDPNYPRQLACGPDYGCGAHLAKKAPRDYGAFAAIGVALSAYALSRRKLRPSARG